MITIPAPFLFLLSALMFITSSSAVAQERDTWDLPMSISDENTKVTFDVDTTWHVVHGVLSDVSGTISLSDPEDYRSITSDLTFTVKKIDTGWGMRNSSLYEHMKADSYPEIRFKATSMTGLCSPDTVTKDGCKDVLLGKLTIVDVEEQVALPVTISRVGDSFKVQGAYTLAWADYNVDDPSIVMAKVQPKVTIQYETLVGAKSLKDEAPNAETPSAETSSAETSSAEAPVAK